MAVRKPLVVVAGQVRELPTVDTFAPASVGLGNVDNTSDANKPVSIAQQAALNAKLNGNIILPSSTDLNTVLTTGFYRLNHPLVNGPTGAGGYGQLIVSRGSNTILQILSDHEKGYVYSRVGVGSTEAGPYSFTAWMRDVSTDSDGKLYTRVVPISGGLLESPELGSALEVRGLGAATDAAFAIFHRPGAFAAGFGLGTDNKWRVGGWSYGAVSYALYHEGNKPTKADVGLANADNTSDANKPVSSLQRTAIDQKALDVCQNLLPNGGLQLGLMGWSSSTSLFAGVSATWGAVATASGLPAGTYVALSPSFDCAPNATYTLHGDSLLLGTGVNGRTYFDFEVYNASGGVVLDSSETPINGAHDFNDGPHRRNEHKLTITTPSTAARMRVRFVADVSAASGSSAIIGFRRVKVENGSNVSVWSDEATFRMLRDQVNSGLASKMDLNIALSPNADLNTLVGPGFYRLNGGLIGAPAGVGQYGQLIVAKGQNTVTQILSNHDNGELWSRSAVGTTNTGPWTWTNWNTLLYGGHLKTVNGQSLVGTGNLQISYNNTDYLIAKKDGQVHYASAALQAESTTGNAGIGLHCAGASAAFVVHERGVPGVRIHDANNNLAPAVVSALTADSVVTPFIDASQTIVLAPGAAKSYPGFSGLLLVADVIAATAIRMYLCGGGTTTLIGSHGSISDLPITSSSSINGYVVTNTASGSRTISILAIRMRTWG